MEINGEMVTIKIDTGAAVFLISEDRTTVVSETCHVYYSEKRGM